MAKKPKRLKLNERRKYLGIWVDNEIHDSLKQIAYNHGETLSQFLRDLLDKTASEK